MKRERDRDREEESGRKVREGLYERGNIEEKESE